MVYLQLRGNELKTNAEKALGIRFSVKSFVHPHHHQEHQEAVNTVLKWNGDNSETDNFIGIVIDHR